MGLAASQARLLSITQRISDNELRAQLINNQKMRLNSESSRVSENYIAALNKTNLVFSNYDSEDNAQNVPLTFNNLTAFNQYNNQYCLTNTAGNVLISEDDLAKYLASKNDSGLTDKDSFLEQYDIYYTTSYWGEIDKQLRQAEEFYATPNLNKVVDAGDGEYAFHEAAELKAMYEGTNGNASYLETIKTAKYTDFCKYYDAYSDEMAKYNNQLEEQLKARSMIYANICLDSSFPKITVNDFNLSTTGDITTSKTLNLSNFFTTYSTSSIKADRVELKDYLPNLETDLGLKVDPTNSQKRYLELNWEDTLNSNITMNIYDKMNDSPSGNPRRALYYRDGSGNLFIQIATLDSSDENANSYWMKIGDNGGYNTTNKTNSIPNIVNALAGPQTNTDGDIVSINDASVGRIFQMDASGNMSYAPTTVLSNSADGVTCTQSISYNNLTKKLTTKTTGESDNTTYTTYPEYGTSDISCKRVYDLNNTEDYNAVETLIADYLNKNWLAIFNDIMSEDNGGTFNPTYLAGINPATTGITDEMKTLANNPVDSEMPDIISNLSEMLTGSSSTISDGKEMQLVLDIIHAGTKPGLDQESGKYVVKYQWDKNDDGIKEDQKITLADNAISLINALTCDTLMNIFGEPIYGYMKQDASGNWVTAEEEAQWYGNLYEKIKTSGYQVLAKGLANSTDWMQFAFENGIVVMEQITTEKTWQGIQYTSCSDILEETDTQAAAIAEAEYNKAMRQIEAKDEMYDMELKNIDTEHASLESEYESVKKAMTGNIERTFQMYG